MNLCCFSEYLLKMISLWSSTRCSRVMVGRVCADDFSWTSIYNYIWWSCELHRQLIILIRAITPLISGSCLKTCIPE